MANSPLWTWCPLPNAAKSIQIAVDIANMGDGYTHRATRGLNPIRQAWSLSFPFEDRGTLYAMDSFLATNAVGGFYIQPPDQYGEVFVTVDAWSSTITDRARQTGEMVGTLQATFTLAFNPQPANKPR
jgi:phage-related protein